MGDNSQDPNTLGTLKCGVVDCTSLKIGGTEFPANAASNSNQQILPADPKKGDMLFWNGNEWGLVEFESGSEGALLLTLIEGVPVWKSYNIQAGQVKDPTAEETLAAALPGQNASAVVSATAEDDANNSALIQSDLNEDDDVAIIKADANNIALTQSDLNDDFVDIFIQGQAASAVVSATAEDDANNSALIQSAEQAQEIAELIIGMN